MTLTKHTCGTATQENKNINNSMWLPEMNIQKLESNGQWLPLYTFPNYDIIAELQSSIHAALSTCSPKFLILFLLHQENSVGVSGITEVKVQQPPLWF